MAGTLDRRSFLKLGAASAGAAIGCGTREAPLEQPRAPAKMRYRPLGATGLEVSEIAFGAHGVDNPPLMAAALEAGITTFCTSGRYLDGREEEALGEAIARTGAARDRIVIFTGNVHETNESVSSILAGFDGSLRRLRTEYIDVYYNAMVKTPRDVRADALFDAFESARRAGKVRHLGLSGHHGGMQDCLIAGLETGRYEVFFTKYDFVSYPDQDEILRRATAAGIGTVVFKTDAGNRRREIEDLERGGLSFRQATIRWALTNPDVASVAVTLTSFDQIRECVAAVGAGLAPHEVAMLRRYAREMEHRYCRLCATCEGSCAHGVAVADIMRYEMYFTCYGREKEAMRLYRELPRQATATACAGCAAPCDGACPFGREVRAGLVDAHRRLSWSEA